MTGLLEVADVEHVGSSFGTSSYQIDAPGCFLASNYYGICDPAGSVVNLSGLESDEGRGYGEPPSANVFSVVVDLQTRIMRSAGNEDAIIKHAIEFESEKAAGYALWGPVDGTVDVSIYAASPISAGSTVNDSLGLALQEFWKRAVGVDYSETVVHLGIQALLALRGSAIKNVGDLGIRFATSPLYPALGVAVTGPVKVRLGDIEYLQSTDNADNTGLTEANRLGAIEFDPCMAVRVGEDEG